MSASLVGSEMCIRDRRWPGSEAGAPSWNPGSDCAPRARRLQVLASRAKACLLYTSDAADDM
eukprot:13690896-Alexandrium_andersonii.AAC.1